MGRLRAKPIQTSPPGCTPRCASQPGCTESPGAHFHALFLHLHRSRYASSSAQALVLFAHRPSFLTACLAALCTPADAHAGFSPPSADATTTSSRLSASLLWCRGSASPGSLSYGQTTPISHSQKACNGSASRIAHLQSKRKLGVFSLRRQLMSRPHGPGISFCPPYKASPPSSFLLEFSVCYNLTSPFAHFKKPPHPKPTLGSELQPNTF